MTRADGPGPRTLAGGALLASLALILGLAAYYLPVVGAALTFVTPLPVTVAYLRYNWRIALMATAVAVILSLIIGGPLVGVFVLFGCAIGIALGYGIIRNWPGGRTIILSGIVGFAGTVASFLVSLLVLGGHLFGQMIDMTREVLDSFAAGLAGAAPGNESLLAQLEQTTALMVAYPWPFIGLSLLLSSFLYAYIWYAVCAPALVRLGFGVPPLPAPAPVAGWQLRQGVGLLCMVGYIGIALYGGLVNPGIAGVPWASWLLVLFTLPVMFHGLGFAAYAITQARPPAALRRMLITVVGLGAFFAPAVTMLLFWGGLADVALDLRRRLAGRPSLPRPGGHNREGANDPAGEWRLGANHTKAGSGPDEVE